jgi:PIN domain nuclease of toxin-antitoxin system
VRLTLIYLDTHVVVWLYGGYVEKFSQEVRGLINEPDLLISPVVCLELQYLYEIQRITVDAATITVDLATRLGLTVCNKAFEAIVAQAILLSWTRDPFDRLIVANASLYGNVLISQDRNIHNHYPQTRW